MGFVCKAWILQKKNGEDGILMKLLLLQACTDCIAHKCLYEQEAFFPSFFLVKTFIEKN